MDREAYKGLKGLGIQCVVYKKKSSYRAYKEGITMALSIRELVGDIEEVEVNESAMEVQSQGGNFVKKNGMYIGTIERAFLSETKSGGYVANIHISGASTISLQLYIINKDKKTKKLVIDGNYNGKTIKNLDAINLLQLFYICEEKLVNLLDLPLEEEEITYKQYGKEKTETVHTLVGLAGNDINYALTAKEQYNYEDGEEDKTALKTDKNGDLVYQLKLLRFYGEDKKVPSEMIRKLDTEQYDKDKVYVESDKAVKKLELEEVSFEEEATDDGSDDEIPDF